MVSKILFSPRLLDFTFFQVSMPKRIGSRKDKKNKGKVDKDWEDALQAVLQDITTKSSNKEQQVVQIVVYESSV